MAGEAPKLVVRFSLRASLCLQEIWGWNAETYGHSHADSYIEFLLDHTDALATEYDLGKPTSVPGCFYVVVRRGKKGHGHVVIYTVSSTEVNIVAIFHTRQDWLGKLERGEY